MIKLKDILTEATDKPKVGDQVDIVTSSYYTQKIVKVTGSHVIVDNKKGKKAPAVILGKKNDKMGFYKPTFKIKISNLKKSKYQHQDSVGITNWILKSVKSAIDGKDLEFAPMGRGTVFGFVSEGKLTERINVEKFVKAVEKGKDVVVYDKKGKRYNLQGGDKKSVQVTDHWEDAGRRNVHPERTWQELPLSKVKKIVIEGKLNEDKFIAFYKKDRVTVNAKSLWDAKKQIIAKLKVPKKDVGLVSVLNKTEYDKQKFRFEAKLTEGYRQVFYGFYKGKKMKFWADFPSDAKKYAIDAFKAPKSKWGDVIILSKSDYDQQQSWHKQYEGKLNIKFVDLISEDIVKDIKKQIGQRTLRYVGARNYTKGTQGGKKYLEFNVRGRKLKQGGKIRVLYNKSKDLYDIEAWQIKGMEAKKIKLKTNITNTNLGDIIEDMV